MDQIPPITPPTQPTAIQQPLQVSPPVEPPARPLSKYYFFILGFLILLLILIPLVFYPKATGKNAIPTPIAIPTPSFTLKNVNPAIAATDASIQKALSVSQSNLAAISQIDVSPQASNATQAATTTAKNVLTQTIQLLTQENQKVDALAKELTPLTQTSSNAAVLTKPAYDLNNNIIAITITLSADASLLNLLTPTSNNRQETFTTILQDLASVQTNFADSRNNLADIRTKLFVIPSVTPSAVPCTSRPACLDAHPACKIAEPIGGWCTTTPTPATPTATLTPQLPK